MIVERQDTYLLNKIFTNDVWIKFKSWILVLRNVDKEFSLNKNQGILQQT